jgi:hypothetical protein
VLILTSATLAEVGAAWPNAISRGSQNLQQRSLSKGTLLFEKVSFNKLSRQREGYKYSFARTLTFGLMGQPRTTVNHLFNFQLHSWLI